MSARAGTPHLRVALVYDALYPHSHGGAERRFHELATRLADRYEVHMLSWQYGPGSDDVPGIRYDGVGRAPDFYGDDGRRTVREAVGFARRILPTLIRGRFDVIDCSATPYLPAYSTALAARMTGSAVVVTWHEVWDDYWLDYLRGRPVVAAAARHIERAARRIGTRAVAVSSFTADRLAAAGPGPAIEVVPNGAPLAAIAAARPVLPGADVLFVGRLIADKRVDCLLGAMARVRAHRPDASCAIIGDGPERGRLEARSRALGLEGSVRFLGRVDEVTVLGRMKSAALLAVPSVREGFGITVVEAQAAGAVPIVARSPMSGAPALVRDGVDGMVCEPSAIAFAAAIEALLADPARRARMSAAARQAAGAYDWNIAAEHMARIYDSLAGSRQAARDNRAANRG